ncbi:MAG: hypothetical protein LBO72_10440, partial [Helicobacteraceae bacterium]|nr:hypothetical protein [Helicobacteraceae bacterium]
MEQAIERGENDLDPNIDNAASKFPTFDDSGLTVSLSFASKKYEGINESAFDDIKSSLTDFSEGGADTDCGDKTVLYKQSGSLLACVERDGDELQISIANYPDSPAPASARFVTQSSGSRYPTEEQFTAHFGVIAAKLPVAKLARVKLGIIVKNDDAAKAAKSKYEEALESGGFKFVGGSSGDFSVDKIASKFPPFSEGNLTVNLKYASKQYKNISQSRFNEIEGLLTGFKDDGKSGYGCDLYKSVGSLLACVSREDDDDAEIALVVLDNSRYPTEAEFNTHFGVISAKLPFSNLDEVKRAIRVTNNGVAKAAKSSYENALHNAGFYEHSSDQWEKENNGIEYEAEFEVEGGILELKWKIKTDGDHGDDDDDDDHDGDG